MSKIKSYIYLIEAELEVVSKSGVVRLVNALEERGYIRRLKGRARAIELVHP